MPKFIKRPVEIEAWYIPNRATAKRTKGICTGGADCPAVSSDAKWPHVHTLEGTFMWAPHDWLIKGIAGEYYFCKPTIFHDTYEVVE